MILRRAALLSVLLTAAMAACAQTPAPSREDELARAGYPAPIKLADAVVEFNKRAMQDRVGKQQPPLKAEEVIASIRAWVLADDPIDKAAYASFQKIAATGMLPKGAYLRFIPGVVALNGFDIDVWWIDLQIDLDRYPTDLADVPMHARRVRTSYVTSRPHPQSRK